MEKRLKKDEHFEVEFYEGILKKSPDFVEALSALGDLYTKEGRYEDGLKVDQRLAVLRSSDPVVLYNLACDYSLLNKLEESFRLIQEAIERGYDDIDHLLEDTDLANLKTIKPFREFISEVAKKPLPQKS